MDSKIDKSLLRILGMAAQHSERFRLAQLDLDAVPIDGLLAISSDMIDLMEARVAQWQANAPLSLVAKPSGGQRTKRRPGFDFFQ